MNGCIATCLTIALTRDRFEVYTDSPNALGKLMSPFLGRITLRPKDDTAIVTTKKCETFCRHERHWQYVSRCDRFLLHHHGGYEKIRKTPENT